MLLYTLLRVIPIYCFYLVFTKLFLTSPLNRLENTDGIGRAGHAARQVQRRARKEKGPPLLPRALGRQRFDVKHLANGHTPVAQQEVVQAPVLVHGYDLEAVGVAADGREMVVPQPLQGLLAAFDADPGVGVGDELVVLLLVVLVVPLGPARADEQNVTGAEGDAGVLGHFVELGDGDGMAGHGAVLDALAGGVGDVVEEDAAADDAAALGPFYVVRGGVRCLSGYKRGGLTLNAQLAARQQVVVVDAVVVVARLGIAPVAWMSVSILQGERQRKGEGGTYASHPIGCRPGY